MKENNKLFFEVDSLGPINYRHNENYYVDFDKDRLLFHMNSTEGPCICKGDVNNDGKEDVFIGGAYGYPGSLYVQQRNGKFKKLELNLNQKMLFEQIINNSLRSGGDEIKLNLFVINLNLIFHYDLYFFVYSQD